MRDMISLPWLVENFFSQETYVAFRVLTVEARSLGKGWLSSSGTLCGHTTQDLVLKTGLSPSACYLYFHFVQS